MASAEGKDDIEQTHCFIPKVYVFQIPKLQTSSGYKASDWPKTPIWSGQLRVVSKGDKCSVLLEHTDKDGLFAACPVNSDQTVEPTTDSSRYFVLRMTDGARHAVIGIGFNDRKQEIDFKVSLQDWKNSNKEETGLISSTPLADLSIPQGGRIHVNLSGAAAKKKSTTGPSASGGASLVDAVSSLKLAEPTKTKEKKKKKSAIATGVPAQPGTANLFDFSGGAAPASDPFSSASDPFASTPSSDDPFASSSSSSSSSSKSSKPAKQADPSDWVSF